MRHVTVFLFFVSLLASPAVAWSHAKLTKSTPANGATVEKADTIALDFNSPVERKFARLVLSLADGSKRPLSVQESGGLTERIEIPVGALPAGNHVLRWSVVSRDGHRISGVVRFTIAKR